MGLPCAVLVARSFALAVTYYPFGIAHQLHLQSGFWLDTVAPQAMHFSVVMVILLARGR